jgi:phosphoribosylformylglycinamidine synthase
VSNGGIAVALAEMSMPDIGCHVDLEIVADNIDAVGVLYSESQARALVATSNADRLVELAQAGNVPIRRIGHTAHGVFLIERGGVPLVRIAPQELHRVWRTSFERHLGGEDVIAH